MLCAKLLSSVYIFLGNFYSSKFSEKNEMLEKLVCNQRILEFAPTCSDVIVTTKVIFDQNCNSYFHPFKRKNIQPTKRVRPNSHVKRQLKSYPLNPRKSKYICAKRPPSLFDFVAISYSHVTIQFWSIRNRSSRLSTTWRTASQKIHRSVRLES